LVLPIIERCDQPNIASPRNARSVTSFSSVNASIRSLSTPASQLSILAWHSRPCYLCSA